MVVDTDTHLRNPVLATGERDDIERMLALTHRHLGMEVAWLSTFTDTEQVIVAASGNITRELPVTGELNIGSYAGVRWRSSGGTAAGMLCCVSRHPRADIDADATRFLDFIADVLSEHLSSSLLHQRHHTQRSATNVQAVLADHAIRPVFQPVKRLCDDTTVAYEALTRFPPLSSPRPTRPSPPPPNTDGVSTSSCSPSSTRCATCPICQPRPGSGSICPPTPC